MAPPKRPWFRLYTETIWDRKIRRLTPPQRWLWVAVLALARQSPVPGILILSHDPLEVLSSHDIADAAALKESEVSKGLERFESLGLIVKDTSLGAWAIARWNDRQYESDVTANRTAKHRRKNVPSRPDVTPPEVQSQKSEAETDTPTASSPPAEDDRFEEFWKRYPKRDGKKLGKGPTHTVWKRLSKAKREAAFTGVDNYRQACEEGITKAKDPIRWLRGQVWEDWQTPAEPDPEKPRTNGSKWEDARLTAPAPYRTFEPAPEPEPGCEHSTPMCEACRRANLEKLDADMKAAGLR